MAKVRLQQMESHVAWHPGEIVTVQVAEIDEATNTYVCDTLETFPADLKERHQSQLNAQAVLHQQAMNDLREQLAPSAPEPEAEPVN